MKDVSHLSIGEKALLLEKFVDLSIRQGEVINEIKDATFFQRLMFLFTGKL